MFCPKCGNKMKGPLKEPGSRVPQYECRNRYCENFRRKIYVIHNEFALSRAEVFQVLASKAKSLDKVFADNLRKHKIERFNDAQQKAFTVVLREVCQGKRRGIISLPTGAGKTLLSACLAREILLKEFLSKGRLAHIIVLAPRRVIRHQIEKGPAFRGVFEDLQPVVEIKALEEGNTPMSERLCRYLNEEWPNIIITTPQLIDYAFRRAYQDGDEYFRERLEAGLKNIGILILDEVHHTYHGENIWPRAISKLVQKCEYVIGLTATPTRESVENIGDLWYVYPIDEAMRRGIITSVVKIYCHRTDFYEPYEKECDVWRGIAIKDRAEKYAERLLEIILEEAESFGQNRILRTVVACPNISEAEMMVDALRRRLQKLRKNPERVIYPYYTGADRKLGKKLDKILDEFKASREGILVAVNMVDIGFDDKNLEVLVLARQLKSPVSYVQLRGRVLRKPDDDARDWNIKTKYAIIIDFAENYKKEKLIRKACGLNFIERGRLEELETGEYASYDMQGGGEVNEIQGHVEIEDHGIMVVTPKGSGQLRFRIEQFEKCLFGALINALNRYNMIDIQIPVKIFSRVINEVLNKLTSKYPCVRYKILDRLYPSVDRVMSSGRAELEKIRLEKRDNYVHILVDGRELGKVRIRRNKITTYLKIRNVIRNTYLHSLPEEVTVRLQCRGPVKPPTLSKPLILAGDLRDPKFRVVFKEVVNQIIEALNEGCVVNVWIYEKLRDKLINTIRNEYSGSKYAIVKHDVIGKIFVPGLDRISQGANRVIEHGGQVDLGYFKLEKRESFIRLTRASDGKEVEVPIERDKAETCRKVEYAAIKLLENSLQIIECSLLKIKFWLDWVDQLS